MIFNHSSLTTIKHSVVSKLSLGAASVMTLAVVGTTGVASAAPHHHHHGTKPSKAQCAAAGFNNYGQCVKEWAHGKNHGHHGYGQGNGAGYGGGNGNNVDTNITVNANHSSHNVISVVINYIFG